MKKATNYQSHAVSSLICLSILFLVSTVQSGCSIGEEGRVKKEVKEVLNDPSSAEFRNIKVFENGNYCGEVNAKNKMGGYVGFQSFFKIGSDLEFRSGIGPESLCYQARDPVAAKCEGLKGDIESYQQEVKLRKREVDKIESTKEGAGGIFWDLAKKELAESENGLQKKLVEMNKLRCK